jgi:hypothetical protein
LTNSNLTLVTNNLAMALKEIDGLKALVGSLLDAKGAAERATAAAAAHGRRLTDVPAPIPVEVVNAPLKVEPV